jgi:hypothetical protein
VLIYNTKDKQQLMSKESLSTASGKIERESDVIRSLNPRPPRGK